MTRRSLIFIAFALLAGGATWAGLRMFGSGPLRADAVQVACMAAAFAYALRYLRLVAPTDRHSRSRANLTDRGKRALLILFGTATIGFVALAVVQGLEGYTELPPSAVTTAPTPPDTGFYVAEGKPQLEALYRLGGPDGERFLVPLDAYEGRLLIVVDEMPPTTSVRVTGRLLTELRTVQTSAEGQSEGPFLPLYRTHMRLPENTRIVFLDTGVRAGLNLPSVLLVLVPAYLFLLTLGAPTRRKSPGLKIAPAPDPRISTVPRRSRRQS